MDSDPHQSQYQGHILPISQECQSWLRFWGGQISSFVPLISAINTTYLFLPLSSLTLILVLYPHLTMQRLSLMDHLSSKACNVEQRRDGPSLIHGSQNSMGQALGAQSLSPVVSFASCWTPNSCSLRNSQTFPSLSLVSQYCKALVTWRG